MNNLKITSDKRHTLTFSNVPDEALPAIKNYIKLKIGRKPNVPEKLDKLFYQVCRSNKVSPALVIKRNRKREILIVRQVFIWLAYAKYGFYR